MAGNNDEVYILCYVMPKRITSNNNKRQVIILSRLTTDGHKASRGLSATAELLVLMTSVDTAKPLTIIYLYWKTYARFYKLGLTRELTNPRVGVIQSLFLG